MNKYILINLLFLGTIWSQDDDLDMDMDAMAGGLRPLHLTRGLQLWHGVNSRTSTLSTMSHTEIPGNLLSEWRTCSHAVTEYF